MNRKEEWLRPKMISSFKIKNTGCSFYHYSVYNCTVYVHKEASPDKEYKQTNIMKDNHRIELRLVSSATWVYNTHLKILYLWMVRKSYCTASYRPFLYRRRPPKQNGERRKRHYTKCMRLRPHWRSPRRLRVPGHTGRMTLSRHPPPPIVNSHRPKSVIFRKSG